MTNTFQRQVIFTHILHFMEKKMELQLSLPDAFFHCISIAKRFVPKYDLLLLSTAWCSFDVTSIIGHPKAQSIINYRKTVLKINTIYTFFLLLFKRLEIQFSRQDKTRNQSIKANVCKWNISINIIFQYFYSLPRDTY